MIDALTASYALTLGALTFLSPCGLPMLPAYLAYYLGHGGEGGEGALRRGLVGGLAAAAGGMAVFAAVAVGAWFLGNPFKEGVIHLELVGGVVVLALGALTLAGRGLSITVPVAAPQRKGLLGLVAFGGLYAAVAAGCSVPLLLAVIAIGLQAGALPLMLLLYAVGLVGLLAAATVAVSLARHGLVARLRAALPYVRWVGGSVMLLVGAYLLSYWYRFGGLEALGF